MIYELHKVLFDCSEFIKHYLINFINCLYYLINLICSKPENKPEGKIQI